MAVSIRGTSRHTPGPWRADSPSPFLSRRIWGPGVVTVALVRRDEDVSLVVAAPELLDALKACVKDLGDLEQVSGQTSPGLALARAALAKSEGGAA
jgi:hypothetical protein